MARRIAPSAARTAAPTSAPVVEEHVLRFDDAPEFSFRTQDESMDDMAQQVKEAQERLAALRAQQEEVERQKQILENLRQKQERFVSGKKEITDKLETALNRISSELVEARRRVDELSLLQQDFEERLEDLKNYLPERWQRHQLDVELDKALTSLDEAETSYEKGARRLMQQKLPSVAVDAEMVSPIHKALSQNEEQVSESEDFGASDSSMKGEVSTHAFFASGEDWITNVKRGFAFHAALIGALLLLLLLARAIF